MSTDSRVSIGLIVMSGLPRIIGRISGGCVEERNSFTGVFKLLV